MILRMSTLFLRTLREDPADAEVPSHRLLVRAGYIRRAAPGIYSWLPLGWRVLRTVERIIREEMDAIGAQEQGRHPQDHAEKATCGSGVGPTGFRATGRGCRSASHGLVWWIAVTG